MAQQRSVGPSFNSKLWALSCEAETAGSRGEALGWGQLAASQTTVSSPSGVNPQPPTVLMCMFMQFIVSLSLSRPIISWLAFCVAWGFIKPSELLASMPLTINILMLSNAINIVNI